MIGDVRARAVDSRKGTCGGNGKKEGPMCVEEKTGGGDDVTPAGKGETLASESPVIVVVVLEEMPAVRWLRRHHAARIILTAPLSPNE